jgi:hypothetical protein
MVDALIEPVCHLQEKNGHGCLKALSKGRGETALGVFGKGSKRRA